MRDISVSIVATGVIQVANVATGILAARLLLPEGRGELAEPEAGRGSRSRPADRPAARARRQY